MKSPFSRGAPGPGESPRGAQRSPVGAAVDQRPRLGLDEGRLGAQPDGVLRRCPQAVAGVAHAGQTGAVTTLFVGEAPPVVADWLDERRRLGQDRRDEIWNGVLHVAPYAAGEHAYLEAQVAIVLSPFARAAGLFLSGSFNLGQPGDYRVPDHGIHRELPRGVYVAAAAMVVEILSPGDETFQKFPFYAGRGVDEIVVIDGKAGAVRIWQLRSEGYDETDASGLLGVTCADIAAEIDWP